MSTQELELSRLEPWLRANVPGFDGPLSAEKFPGGQSNPTFKLTAGGMSMCCDASHRANCWPLPMPWTANTGCWMHYETPMYRFPTR